MDSEKREEFKRVIAELKTAKTQFFDSYPESFALEYFPEIATGKFFITGELVVSLFEDRPKEKKFSEKEQRIVEYLPKLEGLVAQLHEYTASIGLRINTDIIKLSSRQLRIKYDHCSSANSMSKNFNIISANLKNKELLESTIICALDIPGIQSFKGILEIEPEDLRGKFLHYNSFFIPVEGGAVSGQEVQGGWLLRFY